MTDATPDLSRFCVHTITNKPWTLEECIQRYAAAGARGITIWRDALAPVGAKKAAKLLRDAGLAPASLCRAGFFCATGAAEREAARADARRAIDDAAELGAPVVVLVCGAVPRMDLTVARQQIFDAVAAIEPHARGAKVKLAIEPLHPMYADARSAICTLDTANDVVTAVSSPWVGVCVDVYHVWWDPYLRSEIQRAGKTIFAYHVCDWRTPTRDLLNDRGIMGEGCIPLREIRGWVEKAGFTGFIEVEIFSDQYWAQEQTAYLDRIKRAWLKHA